MATVIRRRVSPAPPAAATPVAVKAAGPVKRRVPLPADTKPIRFMPPPEERPAREENEGGLSYVETIKRYAEKVKNPLTAIRAKCVECSGGSLKEVAQCPVTKCALHPFRMGTNPLHKKTRDRLAKEGEDE